MANDKVERFVNAFRDFNNKQFEEDHGDYQVNDDDWLELFIAVSSVTKPGDGLLWQEIKEFIHEEIK